MWGSRSLAWVLTSWSIHTKKTQNKVNKIQVLETMDIRPPPEIPIPLPIVPLPEIPTPNPWPRPRPGIRKLVACVGRAAGAQSKFSLNFVLFSLNFVDTRVSW